jgi:hypothetical protein
MRRLKMPADSSWLSCQRILTIRERLTKLSEVLVLAANVIISYLQMKQLEMIR